MSQSVYIDDECIDRVSKLIYTTSHDADIYHHFSLSVIDALAHVLHIDPEEESLDLQGFVNPESLDTLLITENSQTSPHDAYIWFTYNQCGVFCCNCGRITIYNLNDCPEGQPMPLPFEGPHLDADCQNGTEI